jgi:hypothetical protein
MELSDLLQGSFNNSNTVMIWEECYKVDDTQVVTLLNHDCTDLWKQPRNKFDDINKVVT